MSIVYRDYCKKCWKPLTWLDWIHWPFDLCKKCRKKEEKTNE